MKTEKVSPGSEFKKIVIKRAISKTFKQLLSLTILCVIISYILYLKMGHFSFNLYLKYTLFAGMFFLLYTMIENIVIVYYGIRIVLSKSRQWGMDSFKAFKLLENNRIRPIIYHMKKEELEAFLKKENI